MKFLLHTILLVTLGADAKLRGHSSGTEESQNNGRKLQAVTVDGCSYSKVVAAYGSQTAAATALGVDDSPSAIKDKLTSICGSVYAPTVEFDDVFGEGPQHTKNYFDGDGKWNDKENLGDAYNRSEDAYILQVTLEKAATTKGIKLPDIPNFNTCEQQSAMCCFAEAVKDTDVCAIDLFKSPTSTHIRADGKQWGIINDTTSPVKCVGFAWPDHGVGSNLAGNALFSAVYTNFYQNGYTKNVVGSPLCACSEQMPMVTKASCIDAKASFTISGGSATAGPISFESCAEGTLKEKLVTMAEGGDIAYGYKNVAAMQMPDTCAAGISEFVGRKGYATSATA
jgi:hypothetical protein